MNYSNMLDISGKCVAITGGASGIGLEAAKAFATLGARIELLDIDSGSLEKASNLIQDLGAEVHTGIIDVTDFKSVSTVADEIHARNGALDVLLNSAGIARLHNAIDVSPDEWKLVMDVNVNGTFFCCQKFGAQMVKAGRGSIINMGSMSGTIINRPQFASSYMASKGAVHQLTKALAVEWATKGVRVNALAPGYIATEMTLAMRAEPELFNTWLDMTPMGRCGVPEEVAALIIFLASDASSYMTGAVVPIDGGYTCY